MNVRTTSVPILQSDEAHALYCTNDCLCRDATRRITETKNPQREILRMRANPAFIYIDYQYNLYYVRFMYVHSLSSIHNTSS
jgi:hypothetical protein